MWKEFQLGKQILVIDDNELVRQTVQCILEDEGYTVTCAEDGVRGMAAFRDRRPDLVLTDIMMPEKEGLETIMEMRSDWPGRPIIAMSGGGRIKNANFLKMARELGPDPTLAKPFAPEELS